MNRRLTRPRWAWPLLIAVLVVGLAAAPRLGFTKGMSGTLWTEQPVAVSPTTVTAPNWVQLARALKPAVVNVSTKRTERPAPAPDADDPFSRFFQPFLGPQGPHTVRSLGSGFIVNAAGYIVTNNHVVDGASEIKVRLSDGREFDGKVLGRDPKTDLALLKIDAAGLPVVPVGDSTKLEVGEPVMAIGNPFGLEQTVTTGIVSATGRVIGDGPYDQYIQTDASINPGNSGGPLINGQGQAIGINTAILSQSGGSIGIGFAIPIDAAKPVVAQLAESGHVTRGWLGVTVQRLTPDLAKGFHLASANGALVSDVVPGSPADKAGVKSGDVLVEYDGRKVVKVDEVPRLVADTPVGRHVTFRIIRDGKPVTLAATIAKLDDSPQEAAKEPSSQNLGVAVQPLSPNVAQELGVKDTHGLLVRGVEDGSAAANAGLQAGDVIVEVDHHAVTSVEQLRTALNRHHDGTPVLFMVHRNGSTLYVAVAA